MTWTWKRDVTTYEGLKREHDLVVDELGVYRDASRLTAELVVEQFQKMEEVNRSLQQQAVVERELRERLSDELVFFPASRKSSNIEGSRVPSSMLSLTDL